MLDLRGVTVRGGRGGLVVDHRAALRATGVIVAEASEFGIIGGGTGTTVEVIGSVVRDSGVQRGSASAPGLLVQSGAVLRAISVLVADTAGLGILALGEGSTLELESSVVRGTRQLPDGTGGGGIHAEGGAVVRATAVLVADNTSAGVRATGVRTELELVSSIVRSTRPVRDGTAGYGVDARSGAFVRVTSVLVEDNTDLGVGVGGAGAMLELASCVVRGTHPRRDGGRGQGIHVEDGAAVHAVGVSVADNTEGGAFAHGAGSILELASCVVQGTRPRSDGNFGPGLWAEASAELRATSTLIADNTSVGVLVRGKGTMLELASSIVRGTHSQSDGTGGLGISAEDGAVFRATQVLVTDNTEVGGRAVGSGTVLQLGMSVVRRTRPRPGGLHGLGIYAYRGAAVRATGVLVADNIEIGIGASGAGTTLEILGGAVRRTRPRSTGAFGLGLLAQDGAVLRAIGLLVADSTETGITLHAGTCELNQVIMVGVVPSRLGLGIGIYALGEAQVVASQVALQEVRGAIIAALPIQELLRAQVTVQDVFAREVRSSTVRLGSDGSRRRPEGRAVAYGLHTGSGCMFDATRVVLDSGGFGFFNASGAITLRQGVISRQTDGAGVVDLATPDSATNLESVSFLDNATDTVTRRADLPTASELPSPTRSE
ncbi:MAG: hypothetical protein HY909_02235 [Deltaproteobacteria bacterium]|nr:hypothetical protein [Deltaproteobacteria bacterium]